MENRFNNYTLHRAAEVFKDVVLPPKVQEAFDLWKKVRKHVILDQRKLVGGQYYFARLQPPKKAKFPKAVMDLRLRAIGVPYHDGYSDGMDFLIMDGSDGDSDGREVFLPFAISAGRLFRFTAATKRFLDLTAEMHPAQFYCIVAEQQYTQEFFDHFRETEL